MGQNSKIEWTDHTFNPWWGCEKVSPACAHCYAEVFARRTGNQVWGAKARRRFFGDDHWEEVLNWNDAAKAAKKPAFVFCASMSDVCELLPFGHPDFSNMIEARRRLERLIRETPWLTWLILTKRPDNFFLLFPEVHDWPDNAWAGTTVENQEWADKRLPQLESHAARAPRRFLSCEPLLGSLNLRRWLDTNRFVDWIIAGGESGSKDSRPMHPAWARSLRDQCTETGVSFFFKQWGDVAPCQDFDSEEMADYRIDLSGRDVKCLYGLHDETDALMDRVGKKRAGRLLDGREWNERPRIQRELVLVSANQQIAASPS